MPKVAAPKRAEKQRRSMEHHVGGFLDQPEYNPGGVYDDSRIKHGAVGKYYDAHVATVVPGTKLTALELTALDDGGSNLTLESVPRPTFYQNVRAARAAGGQYATATWGGRSTLSDEQNKLLHTRLMAIESEYGVLTRGDIDFELWVLLLEKWTGEEERDLAAWCRRVHTSMKKAGGDKWLKNFRKWCSKRDLSFSQTTHKRPLEAHKAQKCLPENYVEWLRTLIYTDALIQLQEAMVENPNMNYEGWLMPSSGLVTRDRDRGCGVLEDDALFVFKHGKCSHAVLDVEVRPVPKGQVVAVDEVRL